MKYFCSFFNFGSSVGSIFSIFTQFQISAAQQAQQKILFLSFKFRWLSSLSIKYFYLVLDFAAQQAQYSVFLLSSRFRSSVGSVFLTALSEAARSQYCDITVPLFFKYWILPPAGNPKGLYGGVRSVAEPPECRPAGFPKGGNIQYLKKRGTVTSFLLFLSTQCDSRRFHLHQYVLNSQFEKFPC